MSKIQEMLIKLCPKGVEFKKLADCLEKNTGGGTPSKAVSGYWNGDIPWASVGDLTVAGNYIHTTRSFITAEGLRNSPSNVIKKGDVIVAVKISPGKMKIAAADIAINQDLRGLTLQKFITAEFLTYYFQTIDIIGNGTIVKGITTDTLERIKVPVPPLEIQNEIVKVLDTFSALEAELEAELEARRRQYAYYRDALLSFDEGALSASKQASIRWMTLDDVSIKVSSGGTPLSTRTDYYGGDIPWLRTQEVDYDVVNSTSMTITDAGLENSSAKWIPANCVIVAMYGATAAKVAINGIPLTTNQACCNLQIDPEIASYRYVFHWISNEYERLKSLGEGSQSNLNAQRIKNYPIPVPTIGEQERIVSILDKFDALVNDISQGLPAEITARRQQYEYYRDRLLTFKEAA